MRKLVKQTKIVSRTAYQTSVDQFLSSQAETQVWATGTRLLREVDPAVRQQLS